MYQNIQGQCSTCGATAQFRYGEPPSLRESYACPSCGSTLRWRDQASLILDEFGRGMAGSLEEAVAKGLLNDIDIFEFAADSPFVRLLEDLPGYARSYRFDDVPPGEKTAQGVRCEDLTGLSVPDNSFDLVITSDVIDRLPEYRAALVETLRVLKPGGVHVFSVSNGFPFPERSRAALDTGDDPRSRLYTEFGGDLGAVIAELGGRLTVVRRSNMIAPCHANATFVMRKLAGQAAASPGRVGDASRAQAPSSSGTLVCPICKGVSFEDFNGRKNARCCGCRSVERNRLMWMVLDRLDGFRAGARVLHIAPELFLARHFQQMSGPNYHACDDASRHVASKLIDVRPLDLCQDLGEIPDASYDLIIHSHVLARLPCDVEGVLHALNRLLAPGGRHIFSVPIRGLRTSEEQSPDLTEPDLTEAERKARFGHETHRRIFGAESLQEMLTAVWGPGNHLIEPIELFTRDELRVAGIPLQAWKGVSSHSLFQYQKEPLPS